MPALATSRPKRRRTSPYVFGPSAAKKKRSSGNTKYPVKRYGRRSSIVPTPKHPELTAWNIMNYKPFSNMAGPTFLPSKFHRGAKVPMMLESSHVPTIRTTTGSTTTTGETGNAAVVISPALTSSYYTESGTSLTATDAGLTTTSEHPEYSSFSNLSTEGARYRILGMSARVTYIGSNLDRQGQIAVLYSPVVGSAVPADYSQWENSHHTSSYHTMHKDITTISRLYSEPDFVGMGSAENSFNMASMCLAFTGVPHNSVKIQVRTWIELIPRADSSLADTARPPTYSGLPSVVTSNTTSTMEQTA